MKEGKGLGEVVEVGCWGEGRYRYIGKDYRVGGDGDYLEVRRNKRTYGREVDEDVDCGVGMIGDM